MNFMSFIGIEWEEVSNEVTQYLSSGVVASEMYSLHSDDGIVYYWL